MLLNKFCMFHNHIPIHCDGWWATICALRALILAPDLEGRTGLQQSFSKAFDRQFSPRLLKAWQRVLGDRNKGSAAQLLTLGVLRL